MALGIPSVPDLDVFIHNLEHYVKLSPTIRLHTLPQTYFLGADANFYNGIFSVRGIQDFETAISECIGSEFRLEHLQTGGEKISADTLTQAQLTKLRRVYAKDVEIYSSFF